MMPRNAGLEVLLSLNHLHAAAAGPGQAGAKGPGARLGGEAERSPGVSRSLH